MSSTLARHSSNPNKPQHNTSSHWRKNSGELDVFEAARYFSTTSDEKQRAARRSLDMPMMRSHPIIPPEYHHMMILADRGQDHHDQKPIKENKKYKQPSSPGGRLASFLNSLFSPTHLKKKKSKSGGNGKEYEDESPAAAGRRKRRSSISHFRITANAAPTDKKATYSASNTGFRTPPPYSDTPTKSYKVPAVSPPRNGRNFKITLLEELHAERSGFLGKNSDPISEIRNFNDEDDGAESDSSSDLFDLPNHDSDFFSSGLPVYETTRMDRIKIGAPMSTVV